MRRRSNLKSGAARGTTLGRLNVITKGAQLRERNEPRTWRILWDYAGLRDYGSIIKLVLRLGTVPYIFRSVSYAGNERKARLRILHTKARVASTIVGTIVNQ